MPWPAWCTRRDGGWGPPRRPSPPGRWRSATPAGSPRRPPRLRAGGGGGGGLGGGFGRVAVAGGGVLAPGAGGWSAAEGAGVPVGFLAAWYALAELAGLRAGEKVLIHAAAGGVGMAAVQVARHLG